MRALWTVEVIYYVSVLEQGISNTWESWKVQFHLKAVDSPCYCCFAAELFSVIDPLSLDPFLYFLFLHFFWLLNLNFNFFFF
jgi:hypothetical protein